VNLSISGAVFGPSGFRGGAAVNLGKSGFSNPALESGFGVPGGGVTLTVGTPFYLKLPPLKCG
jgi:hypothetical protein